METDRLTRRQYATLAIATLVTAVTRWFALARTPWDWDEMLFQLAVRRYDVFQHRPHPPGFPLFIVAAKAIRKLAHFDDFHSLQAVNFLAAVAIVPATFFLCRELRMRFVPSLAASLFLAFFPNVWFFGGTAFSDVPSMTLVILAVALLLRGREDDRAFLAGAVVLGIAAGFRPQNLVIGFAPALAAVHAQWRRSVPRVVIAALIGLVIVAASYGGAAILTGVDAYRLALAKHQQYITATDSFRSPARPPLPKVFAYFFVVPYRALPINIAVTALAVVGLWKRRWLALAAFVPFCVFAWLVLDYHSASRFSIGYAPLIAILMADGASLVARRFEAWLAGAVVALMFVWTWPSLLDVHRTVAPPIDAVHYVRNHVDPKRAITLIDEELIPYAEYYLDDFETRFIFGEGAVWGAPYRRGVLLREEASAAEHAIVFRRPRGHLAGIARDRYFDVSVIPLAELVQYGDGWAGEETDGENAWRWMGARSVTKLPAVPSPATLSLAMTVPLELLHDAPTITVRVNRVVIDRFQPARREVSKRYSVASRASGTNELVLETDRLAHAPGDPRNLGIRLDALGWLSEK